MAIKSFAFWTIQIAHLLKTLQKDFLISLFKSHRMKNTGKVNDDDGHC